MFIWDFTAGLVLGQIMDWIYGQSIGFLGEFFAMMGNMGAELFEMSWVQAIVLFFSYLAWALYGTVRGLRRGALDHFGRLKNILFALFSVWTCGRSSFIVVCDANR